MNTPLSPVLCASPHGFFSGNFFGFSLWSLLDSSSALPAATSALVSFVDDTLALICPLCVLCLPIHLHMSHVSKAVLFQVITSLSLFTIHLIPFTPTGSPRHFTSFLFSLTLQCSGSLLWECPAADVKIITIVRYPEAKPSDCILPAAGAKIIAVCRYQEQSDVNQLWLNYRAY